MNKYISLIQSKWTRLLTVGLWYLFNIPQIKKLKLLYETNDSSELTIFRILDWDVALWLSVLPSMCETLVQFLKLHRKSVCVGAGGRQGYRSSFSDTAFAQQVQSPHVQPLKPHNLSVVVSKFQRRKQEDSYRKLKTCLSYPRARLGQNGTVTVLYSFIPFAFYVNKAH